MDASDQPPKKRKKRSSKQAAAAREERIEKVIAALAIKAEQQPEVMKATMSDLIRLLQMQAAELEGSQPKGVKVKWVEPKKEEPHSGG